MSANSVALTQLLIHERRPMLRFLSRYMDPQTCEDTYQNIWLKARSIPDDPPILDARGYLFRLAYHHAIDRIRNEARQRKLMETAASIVENGLEPDTAHVAIARDDLERVLHAAGTLPEPARTIFNLNRFGGLSQAQIAKRLGISTNTVEKYIRRALDHLIDVRDRGA